MNYSNIILCTLQVYFILMSLTVERSYCDRPLVDGDSGFLMQQTYDFSVQHNPLFLERPEWLQKATCVHCKVFPFYYTAVFFAALLDLWHIRPLQMIFLLFVGAKLYAVVFYHYMEFTSHVPPQNLVPYFAMEGQYLASISMVLYKIYAAGGDHGGKTEKAKTK
jgi:hypothetical protein